jgi:SAM-dependent methyltransferase
LWLEQTDRAASPTPAVADLGCGNERLRGVIERLLDAPFAYTGYDLLPQQPSTVQLDISNGLPDETFDAVFSLGVLEYLPEPERFAIELAARTQWAVVTYTLAGAWDHLTSQQRRERGWLHDFTAPDVESLFVAAGFARRAYATLAQGRTGLWVFESARR